MDVAEQIKKFKEFIKDYYLAKLNKNLRKGNPFLEIDFNELAKFDPNLANILLDDPEEPIKAMELALGEVQDESDDIQALIYNLPESTVLPLNEISDQTGRFLTFEGHIMKPSEIFLKCESAKWECPACGNVLSVLMLGKAWKEPKRCSCGRKGKFNLLSKKMIKFQRVMIQEALDKVPDQPRKLIRKTVSLAKNLVRTELNDRFQPGQKVKINGVLELERLQLQGGFKSNEFKINIIANNIIPIEQSWEAIKLNFKQIKKIKEMAKNKNLLNEFAQSLAPSFEGYVMTRKSLILQHIGGKRLFDENGNLEEREIIHVLMCGSPGCQPAGSKVMMANGEWKNIEEIKEGNEVLSPQHNGVYRFSKVTSICQWDSNENYNVIQLNRKKKKLYSCSYNHLIPIYNKFYPRKNGKRNPKDQYWGLKHYTAKAFSGISKNTKNHKKIGFSCFKIQQFKGRKNCEIEPYTLGVFLGDGHFTNTPYKLNKKTYRARQLGITSADFEIINEVSKYYPIMNISEKNGTLANTYYFSLNSQLAKQLQKHNLEGKLSGTKFIPKEALFSDYKYREKLLAGLIDTDGYYKDGYSITTKSLQLAQDILNLVYTLGGRGNIRQIEKRLNDFIGKYYCISFYLGGLRLPLKTKRKIKKTNEIYISSNRIGIDVKRTKSSKVYGFELDSKSNWYITDNFMITHNTGKSYLADRSIIISPLWDWTHGKGLTGVGLVAAVTRDEHGNYTLEVGPFVIADKGILEIDEMEKMNKDDYGMLNNGMSHEKTKITKANINQTLKTRTSILATSNPLHKKFSDSESIIKQFAPIPKDILDRFDVLWPMREKIDSTKLADKYMARHRKKKEGIKPMWSNDEMRNYIAYSKRLIPEIDRSMEKYFNKKFEKLIGKTTDEGTEKSHRLRGNLFRWIYAHTKFRGIGKENKEKEVQVTKEAIDFAFSLMRYSFELLELINKEGFVNYENIEEIPSKHEVNNYYLIKDIINKFTSEYKDADPKFGVPEDRILEEAQNERGDFTRGDMEKEIEKLSRSGDIFEPRRTYWQPI